MVSGMVIIRLPMAHVTVRSVQDVDRAVALCRLFPMAGAPGNQGERYALMQANWTRFSIRVPQPEASIALSRSNGDLPLPKPVRSAMLVARAPGSGECLVE